MQAECNTKDIEFQRKKGREIVGRFDGGTISSDAGGLLLREVNAQARIVEQAAECFKDLRNPKRIEHTVKELVGQRVYGLALGYEDLNDHDRLRYDSMLAVMVDKRDPTGMNRRPKDRGKPLAGKATLNRLELRKADAPANERYKKISFDLNAGMRLFTKLFTQGQKKPPPVLVLDLDATDDPIHGHQEGRFFHGYYGCYCYLPLYIFCGESLLWAELRPSNIDGSLGSVDALKIIVGMLREKWPEVTLIIRGDSGFCRDDLMKWCEGQESVYYILGMSKNARLNAIVEKAMKKAKRRFAETGKASRVYRGFSYRTRKSWSAKRRVVGKAEYLPGKDNQRFVVTSLPALCAPAQYLYERIYCARGDMENRIKEQQLDMFADRTSAEFMRANQIRLWFSSVAYCLIQTLRQIGLRGTSMEKAQCHTIREKLFKIGARIRITLRKVWIHYSNAYPFREIFEAAVKNLGSYPCGEA